MIKIKNPVSRIIILLAAALFVFQFLFCSKPEITNRNSITIAFESAPTNLDPRKATDVPSSRIAQIIYSSLVKFNEKSEIVPDLSYKWDIPDSNTYIFHLRKGVKFHNGEDLKAEDVEYTFKSIMDSGFKSPLRGSYTFLKEVKVLDDYTIRFDLNAPYAPFLSSMCVGIVPKRYAQKSGEDFGLKPVGSGPFRIVEILPDERIILEANESYFGGKPGIKRIVFKAVKDETVRALELEKREINFLENAFSPDTIEIFKNNSEIEIFHGEGTDYYYIGLNLKDSVLENKKVRQAIAYAIDRDIIIKSIERGMARKATGMVPSSHWAYEKEVKDYDYNPERSKKLLDEAGFGDPDGDGPKARFKLVYKTTYEERSRKFGEVLQEFLRKVGISLEIKMYEWGTFYDDIKNGNFQIYRLKWVGITDPDQYYEVFNSKNFPPNGKNRGFYSNSEIDYLTKLGRKTMNIDERKKIYSRIQKIIAEELPYISLWHSDNVAVMSKGLKGFILYPRGEFNSIKDMCWEGIK
ncbi:MAG: hypothetical protein A3C43_03210 [Candidatus Schekmanbacteria bacterium RIFCSPHIGHO2_02_FULL_38_11]|uniref:Solute-binding protein family 5 domain-containing protein n=1 Tax=Candidatus Schekmanbacteria bacterium RIFCSPLOWO2_12_FULL_38_15 TaxID=1817883 RepID=A0A1F7SN57_9BACT|nr:MAG: hypothetical protein A2043_02975 [Candidatus Schekmanbacteria bacterium GWA2_38_9]OGL50103.1 MAG: hypothetical protein A3H37_07295 [Candidatus Schekmanbacteria bacterium RIFCSPLOWO2_02_FULL_38_14]OGL54289.1 MAG: hypothetical protein A3C43_03210 [Candidatus Schekmanbacteria bacterium RIFCSPHIGHO2_02_FULL_38_11]OGL55213.1 MAG: hypothetical protein A3G31_09585 [Candidatus Schekmanbacteria bacterium RIFCSPLOWO2_12_FULL_38_15]